MTKLMYSIVLLGIILTGCNATAKQEEGMGQPTPQLPVIKVETADLESHKSYPVAIEGTQNIAIRAKVDGYISQVFVDEGEWVKKGAPLFKLETRSLSQNAKAAKAAITTAQLEVDKLTPLVESKIVSEIQLQTAKANLERTKSDYQSIQANIEYTNIKSPVTGIVGSINFREGSLVSPATLTELTHVSGIDNVYGFFSLNEKDFMTLMNVTEGVSITEKIRNLPAVKLLMADGTEYGIDGKVETISGQVDKSTGAIKFRATFPNPDRILRNGNSGTIHIPSYHNKVVAIPAACTYEIQGKRHVFVLSDDNQLNTKAISTSKTVGKYIIVESGLNEGETILAKGINKVRPGMKIIPLPSTTQEIINSFQTTFK